MLEVLLLLVDVVSPVFMVVAVGALIGRRFPIEVSHLNRVVIYAALPCLTFRTMAGLEMELASVVRLVAAYLLLLLVMAGVALLFARRLAGPQRRALVATSVFSNSANMMLPVALFAFGQAGLDRALVLYVVTSLTMFSLGPSLLGASVGFRQALKTVLTFPVLWAALLGLLANTLDLTPPLALTRAIGLLAEAAIPMVLMILGIQMARAGRPRLQGTTVTAVALKLLVAPLVGAAVGLALGLTGLDLAVFVTLAAMPTAVNTVMLALEFGGDTVQVGATVVIATASALITLPLVLWTLRLLGWS